MRGRQFFVSHVCPLLQLPSTRVYVYVYVRSGAGVSPFFCDEMFWLSANLRQVV